MLSAGYVSVEAYSTYHVRTNPLVGNGGRQVCVIEDVRPIVNLSTSWFGGLSKLMKGKLFSNEHEG